MSLKNIIFGIFAIACLIAIVYLGVSAYIAYSLTMPSATPITFDKAAIGRGADITFRSSDNLQLAGWYFPGTNDKAIMFVPGAGENRVNEDYGTTKIAAYLLKQGYTILMFDLRGTGESEKTRQSFGQYEKYDVIGAFEYLKTQDYTPKSIGILSDSLGAISTIMAADTVKDAGGIVLDSAAIEVKPAISHLMNGEHHIPYFMHPGVYFWSKTLYQIDPDAVRPIDHIGVLANTPLLFLNGADDDLIPPVNSTELLAEVHNGTNYTFPKTDHVHGFRNDPTKYLELVSDFFNSNLK